MIGVGAAVAVRLVLSAVVAGRWGYHRDEPYYLACAARPAWGYVDHPPGVPALAGASARWLGTAPARLRMVPANAAGAVIVVAALTAGELGGSSRAALVAALATLACPLLVATAHWFQTVPFDVLAGSLALLVWVHLMDGGHPAWWLALGLVIGVGLELKWTMLVVAAAVAAGTLAAPDLRDALASGWPLAGAALALVLWLPNLAWQARSGWPTLAFIRGNRRADGPWLRRVSVFAVVQFTVVGVPLLVLAAVGLAAAWPDPVGRPVAVAAGAAILALAAIGAKPYYHGAFLPLLFALGAVATDGWRPGDRTALVVAVLVWGTATVPLTLPVLSPATAARFGVLRANPELAEELGWPELVDQVRAVLDALPPDERARATVLTRSYGEAAALDLLGPGRGVPAGTALSGHNSYADWWPDDRPAGTVAALGYPPAALAPYFACCEEVGRVESPAPTKAAGRPIVVCRGLRIGPAELREALRRAG
jgi:Dolichyl-phosphate-mannose-protein mannosyltransferase